MERCPRCRRDVASTDRRCPSCGSPLAFGEEPSPRTLDRELDLDRRGRGRGEGPEWDATPPLPDPNPGGPLLVPGRADGEPGPPVDLPQDVPAWADEGPRDAAAPREAEAEGEPPEDPVPEAGGGEAAPAAPARRILAWAVDGLLVGGAGLALPTILLSAAGALGAFATLGEALAANLGVVLPSAAFVAVAAFVYATAAHALAGATLGKWLAGIRVIGPDGAPPGLARSAARSGWALASLLLAGLGFLPALVTPSRRALHDLLAGTRVVDAPVIPPPAW